MIDLHNHILRYVVPIHHTEPDIETAVSMARIAADDGIRIIVSTPHLRPMDVGNRLPEVVKLIRDGVEQLNEILGDREVDVQVVGGAEIALCEDLTELAAEGLLPTLGGGDHLMIELPIVGYAAYAEQVLFELQLAGFTPVIAHFERMAIAPAAQARPEELVARGIKLQVNAGSFCGVGGHEEARLARRLVREGLVCALGSDAHDAEEKPPRISPCRRAVDRAGGRGTFERLTWDEPLRIISEG
ncbi:MAG: CpsB/CapC family capsule biosynthesis tyrosine phosphatase [Armatimonadota bacterium]|nr:CpsB/CapC family capsule biosynthesis tyrosine phosphatase [Armatimonadota bacterium]